MVHTAVPPENQIYTSIENSDSEQNPILSQAAHERLSAKAKSSTAATDRVVQQNKKILAGNVRQYKANPNLWIPRNLEIMDHYPITKLKDHAFVAAKQREDVYCYAVIRWLEDHDATLLFDFAPTYRGYIYSGRYSLSADTGLLLFKHQNTNTVVLPACLRRSYLDYAHLQCFSIHNGISRMYAYMQSRVWWPHMETDVRAYVNMCETCQKVKKPTKRQKYKMRQFASHAPFELVSLDIVGPMPETASGYRYWVTFICHFSRLCMIVPIKDIKATSVLFAMNKWCDTYGHPKRFLSDQGSQFTSEPYRLYCEAHNTKPVYATAYHPQCNGQVERLHRWIKERLCAIGLDTDVDFTDNIDAILSSEIGHATYRQSPVFTTLRLHR